MNPYISAPKNLLYFSLLAPFSCSKTGLRTDNPKRQGGPCAKAQNRLCYSDINIADSRNTVKEIYWYSFSIEKPRPLTSVTRLTMRKQAGSMEWTSFSSRGSSRLEMTLSSTSLGSPV